MVRLGAAIGNGQVQVISGLQGDETVRLPRNQTGGKSGGRDHSGAGSNLAKR